MLEKHSQEKINDVTKAVAAIYNRIDACRNSDDGFVARCSEYNNISTESAMDMIMSEGSDICDFIQEELVEEVVELVQALYWARENVYSFPMKNYGERSDGAKEYMTALNKAIKNAPVEAETMRVKQNSERLHNIVTDFGEWADKILQNPLGTK